MTSLLLCLHSLLVSALLALAEDCAAVPCEIAQACESVRYHAFAPPPSNMTARALCATATHAIGRGACRACLPRLVGVACIGCGSTSLAEYLDAHPSLSFGAVKEHGLLGTVAHALNAPHGAISADDTCAGPRTARTTRPLPRVSLALTKKTQRLCDGGLNALAREYLAGFTLPSHARGGSNVTFDFDPTYAAHAEYEPAWLRTLLPRAKLLWLLHRDPRAHAARAWQSVPFSQRDACTRAYAAAAAFSRETLPAERERLPIAAAAAAIERAVTAAPSRACARWVTRSGACPAWSVARWLRTFERSDIHFVHAADLLRPSTRQGILDGIATFAGLPPHRYDEEVLARAHNVHDGTKADAVATQNMSGAFDGALASLVDHLCIEPLHEVLEDTAAAMRAVTGGD